LGGGAEIGSGALEHAAFWIAVLEIVVVNLLLSGDNAVVIAMACRALPPRQRLWGMAIGAGTAAIVRIIFAAIIAPLMALPYFKLIGGLALFYIAVKLLLPENSGREIEPAARLWRVVRIVAVADIIMGFDNIIAIVGVARGDVALLVIGLVLSIPIILAGAALVMALIDRFPILVWAGAALLGWIAGEIVATDPAVVAYLTARLGASVAGQIEIAAAIVGMLLVIAAGVSLRRVRVD
jgi:YjbE family integral membrane protein